MVAFFLISIKTDLFYIHQGHILWIQNDLLICYRVEGLLWNGDQSM